MSAVRWSAFLALTLLAVAPLPGQAPGGYGPSGGMGPGGGRGWGAGRRGGRMGGQSFDPSALPSPEDIDGPPTPGTFKQLFALSDSQAGQYQRGWDSLMAETAPQRDSARTARETMRSAFQDHDRDAVQQQAKVLERLGKDLRKSNDAFDKSLVFLTDAQRKQYDDWKKEQKKAREDERRQHFRGGGDGPPGSS
jgi:hypothetical protein